MSQRSPKKWMEGSDYEDKCSQRADDVGGMSNREKRKDKSKKKRIGVNRNKMLLRQQALHVLQSWRPHGKGLSKVHL